MVAIPIQEAKIDYSYEELDGFTLTLKVSGGYTNSANKIKALIDKNVPLEFILKRPTEEKTKSQTSYAWASMREMANALGLSVDEVYRKMIEDYGKSDLLLVSKGILRFMKTTTCYHLQKQLKNLRTCGRANLMKKEESFLSVR